MRRLLSWSVRVLVCYALLGFAALPALIHFAAARTAPVIFTEPLLLGGVSFNPFTLRLTLQTVRLGDPDKRLAGFSELTVKLAWNSLKAGNLNIQEISLDRPYGDIILQEDGKLNLASLVQSAEPKDSEVDVSSSSTPVINLERLSISNASFKLTDRAIKLQSDEEFSTHVKNINLNATGLGWPDANASLDLSGNLQPDSAFALSASLMLPDPDAQASIQIDDFSLNVLQPYLTPATFARLRKGYLSAKADVTWHKSAGLNASGNAQIEQLRLEDTRDKSSILDWRSFQLTGLEYRQSSNQLAINNLLLSEPNITITIDQHLKVNLADLVRPATMKEEPTPSAPLTYAIGAIQIDNGSMDFTDYSFRPGFTAPVSRLNGKIMGLDSAGKTPARMTITGQVDQYSPVTINGLFNVVEPLSDSQLAISFDSVELPTLTPYSGRFAGYSIQKGRMNLKLDYRIRDRQLSAENTMLLEQLTLGDKVDSSEAVNLPLKLAIALLKDRDGRIDIQLPVKGDLDNPEFELGPLMRMALVNLITRVVSAPFDLLASLVGGSASEMSAVTFSAGSIDMPPGQQESLDKLVKALQERPELELEVTGKAVRQHDWPVIVNSLLEQEVNDIWLRELENNQRHSGQQQAMISEEDRIRLLQDIALNIGIDAANHPGQQQLTEAITRQWPYDEVALRALAIDRAKQIKDYLTEHGLEAERIYLLDVQTADENLTEQAVQATLELSSG